MNLVPEKLQNIARKQGLSLKQLLERAHVSKTAYYSILRKNSVLPQSIHSLAAALAVKPSALLEEENPAEKKHLQLRKQLEEIIQSHPEADRDNVWHTLLLLEQKPIERLQRGLLRAQKFNFHR